MGLIYRELDQYVSRSTSGTMIEIGSDRGEGSTATMAQYARDRQVGLISVDIDSRSSRNLSSKLPDVCFVVESGETWSQRWQGPIIALYLDNFDYIWDINHVSPANQAQMATYARMGLTMTNQQCQIAHFRQLINLYPWLTADAVIAFDDTYCYNDCWIGKNGPGVVYLLAQGWTVCHQSLDCGVILIRD